MKKCKSIISVVLTAAMLISCIPLSASAADNGVAAFGDVNRDGRTTIKDATEIQKYIASIVNLDGTAFKAADVNYDGKVTIIDASLIQKYLAGTYIPEATEDEPSTPDVPSTGDEPTTTAPPVITIGKPQAITITNRTESSVTLSWSNVANADGYRISKIVNGQSVTLATVEKNVSSYTVNNLADGETALYAVAARKDLAFGDAITIRASALPGEVTNLKASSIGTNSITITWSRLTNADGYRIYKKDSSTNGSYVKYADVAGNVTTFTDDAVTPGGEVRYTVKGIVKEDGVRELLSYSYSVLITATLPNSVSDIKFSDVTTSSVKLSWTAPSGSRTGYKIYRAPSGGSYKEIAKAASTATSFTDTGLSSGTVYKYAVKAYTTVNGTDYNAAYPEKTVKTKIAAVSAFSVSSNTSTSISLSWSKTTGANGYIISRKTGSGSYAKLATINSGATVSWTDKTVKGGTSYTYKINAFTTDNGNTVLSPDKTVTAVAGLQGPDFSFSTIVSRVKLTWTKNPYATGYMVYVSSSQNGTYTKLGLSTSNRFLTKKLNAGQKYFFKVVPYKTVNGVSYYGTSKIKSFTPQSVAFGKNVPSTYVEINIDQQHMWYYVDGKLYCDTDVVTGNYGTHDTTKGYHKILNKASPATLVGADYETVVSYWMGVTHDGIGIHDSTWRSDKEYGGNTYKGDGSHGCINTPYDKVKKMYNKMAVNTPVIIY